MATVSRSPCLTVTERPHKNLAIHLSSRHPMRPSLILAATSFPQPWFMLESRSTHTPVFCVIAPSSRSMSNALADAEDTLRNSMPSGLWSESPPPEVRTVS